MIPYILAQTRLDTHVPSYMTPSGSPAGAEATLGWALTITAVAVTVIVAILLVVAITRRRDESAIAPGGNLRSDDATAISQTDSQSEHKRSSPRHSVVSGLSWIYAGLVITVVILLAAFGGTVVTIARTVRPPLRPAITLDVIAHQWWWEVRVEDSVPSDAFVTANEVHVPVGMPVRVRLRSADVIHSFWVPELFGKMDVIPGQINETWLQADRAGT
ncbi:MAG: hypothetical protein M3R65_09960, partial [Gemmatimonadota bacterium]|nr:hypothetical protein [Gemmatimonadota bacterium]